MGFWSDSRSGGRGCAALLAALAVTFTACGNGSDEPLALGEGTIRSVTVVSNGGDFKQAMDATLSADGQTVYFTANSSQGPGAFRVPASGGTAVAIATGAPFRGPVGIAMAGDGGRVYVSDPEVPAATDQRGVIFSVPLTGGPPAPVPGTEGTTPRGLEVVGQGGSEVLYFTGRDPADGQPAVFKLAVGGTAPATVSKGSPLVSPDAVTVTREGVVFVTDRGSGGEGAVFRVTPTSTEKIAGMKAPVLAGATLTLDESLLLVSTLSPAGTDQVLLVDLRGGQTGVFSKTIGENTSGGGLHRARDANVFAWADLTAGPGRQSRVYVLRP